MHHLMIDIETLDTRPSAVIVSAAGLWFDPDAREQTEAFSLVFDVPMQLANGRTISADTVAWWMQQSYEARKKAFCPEVVSTAGDIQDSINSAIYNAEHIWANDPDFDCTILRDYMSYDFKWPFWKHRSMRTIKAMYPDAYSLNGSVYPDHAFTAHDPMNDCKKQAWHVMNVYGHAFGTPAD